MGFEPMPLSRLAPKASALTTRPNLLYTRLKPKKCSPRGDSNPQPPDPKSDALSIAPLGQYELDREKTSKNEDKNPEKVVFRARIELATFCV